MRKKTDKMTVSTKKYITLGQSMSHRGPNPKYAIRHTQYEKTKPISISIGGIRYVRRLTCSTVQLLYFLALSAANPISISKIGNRKSQIAPDFTHIFSSEMHKKTPFVNFRP